MSGIFVVMEQQKGCISSISWEALAAGQQLGTQLGQSVCTVLVGAQTGELANEFTGKPLGRVVCVEHPLLGQYTADGFTLALHQLVQSEAPAYVIFPHTYQVRDYAPALAARMGQVLIGDVVEIGEGPIFKRQLLQGRMDGVYRPTGNGPCFLSVQSGAFHPAQTEGNASSIQDTTSVVPQTSHDECRALAPVSVFTPILDPAQIRTSPGEPFRDAVQTVDLGSAQLIVSVGRGIKDAGNIPLVAELATALGAELAASRPICDQGWLPAERQVGSSGHTVSPKLYLAIGISGAIQHLVGMKGSQCIVAINKDPDAPIFEVADYGIVGDLFEVVPALTAAVKAAKQ
jgi:electron transfer flavoprotein alpha subunit